GDLALRTIGYARKNSQSIGLEASYDEYLKGEAGKRMVQYISPTKYIPINDLTEIEPKNGDDIHTTINVQMQDIAGQALRTALDYHKASYGTVIIMEVKSGNIKAMSNLKRDGGVFTEDYNYAAGLSTEPGSTFKLASVMAILEDKMMSLDKEFEINYGKSIISGREMKDSEGHGHAKLSLRRAFELSSNIGISKAVVEAYGGSREGSFKFVDRIKQFHLDKITGIDLPGEGKPLIKTPYNLKQLWSKSTLAWMAHGYETQLTPLQLLTFYNAVANNGKMMQPRLVTGVWSHGEMVKDFQPKVLVDKIASDTTIMLARTLLEGVVLNGTARRYKNDMYSFAGKTGTASLDYGGIKRGRYRASFIGYFPADNPMYSICVSITEPREHGYHGAEVALPVFRSVADKILSFDPKFFKVTSPEKNAMVVTDQLPQGEKGYRTDFLSIFNRLGVPVYSGGGITDFIVTRKVGSDVNLMAMNEPPGLVPDVTGMGLRDALYALESRGLKAEVNGYGRVSTQNISPGTKVSGQKVVIRLE
ncbi:MAG TPA: penicillin-binding transpeptidase domain-containing protein, partial [Saprospiraceae bacterium]|nr:penicillin-binding transpeptidase domain-containing protein [Saprospiraceae bacterium]